MTEQVSSNNAQPTEIKNWYLIYTFDYTDRKDGGIVLPAASKKEAEELLLKKFEKHPEATNINIFETIEVPIDSAMAAFQKISKELISLGYPVSEYMQEVVGKEEINRIIQNMGLEPAAVVEETKKTLN